MVCDMKKQTGSTIVIAIAVAMTCGVCTAKFSIQREIDRVAANGGGQVTVPAGEHLTDGPIKLKSNIELHLETGAKIIFPDDPEKYLPAVPTSWEGVECLNYSPLVYASQFVK